MTTEDDYSDEDLSERAARLLGAAATGSPGGDLTVALDELERHCDMVGRALVHLKRVTLEREAARAEVERLRGELCRDLETAHRHQNEAIAYRDERDESRAEVARLRRLALVPMAPGEVPEKPGWYVVDSGKPVQVWLDDCDNFGGAQEPFVWDVDAQCAVPVTDWAGRWLARIPVDALTTD